MISFASKAYPARKNGELRARRTPGGVQDLELGRGGATAGAPGGRRARLEALGGVTLRVSRGVNSIAADGVNHQAEVSNLKGLRALCTRRAGRSARSATVNLRKSL